MFFTIFFCFIDCFLNCLVVKPLLKITAQLLCLRIAGAGESIMIFFFSGSRIHFLFFICVLFSILLFFYLLMYIYIHSCVTLITYLKIYSSPNLSFSLSFLFDLNSCFFRLLVCFITSRVLVFTSYYIGRYSNPR